MFNQQTLQNLMAKAYHHALKSPDPSNQNGAVLVHRHTDGELEIVCSGYNHFYEGVPAIVDDRDEKMKGIEHAERDTVFEAAKRGVKCQGAIMICPWAACYECARAIIGSGISALVYHHERYLTTPDRWSHQVDEALDWMHAKGIYIYVVEGAIPSTNPINVNGHLWSPAGLQNVPSA